MGLTANDGRRRKSYYAFKTTSEQLGNYVLVRQVAGARNLTSGVQAFLFRARRDYKLVVWDVDGARGSVALQGALQEARVVSVVGERVLLTPDPVQYEQISVGAYLIVGISSDDGIEQSSLD